VNCNFRRLRSLCVFELPLRGLEATYDAHLRLTGKRVVDFMLVLIELFSLVVTVEALQAKMLAFDRQTNRRTERPWLYRVLHYMQWHGKKHKAAAT